jgi:hypothetical protein
VNTVTPEARRAAWKRRLASASEPVRDAPLQPGRQSAQRFLAHLQRAQLAGGTGDQHAGQHAGHHHGAQHAQHQPGLQRIQRQALFRQRAFQVVLQLRHVGADRVHRVLSAPRSHQRQGRFVLAAALQCDCLRDLGEFLLRQVGDAIDQPGSVGARFGRAQFAQPRQLVGQLRRRDLVDVQIRLVGRDQETALPGLGAEQRIQHLARRLLHGAGVLHGVDQLSGVPHQPALQHDGADQQQEADADRPGGLAPPAPDARAQVRRGGGGRGWRRIVARRAAHGCFVSLIDVSRHVVSRPVATIIHARAAAWHTDA